VVRVPTNYIEALEALLNAERDKMRMQEEMERIRNERSANELPPVLKATHIAEIMGISLPTVYVYMRLSDFPLLEGHGTKRVLRDSFFNWLKSRERTSRRESE
jgi:predicted DNA-binding transcriptional regulator AlpA